LDGDAGEDAGIGIRSAHFVDDAEGGVADLFAGVPEVVFRGVGDGDEQAVANFEAGLLAGGDIFMPRDAGPPGKVFSVEELPFGGGEASGCRDEKEEGSKHALLLSLIQRAANRGGRVSTSLAKERNRVRYRIRASAFFSSVALRYSSSAAWI